MDSHVYAPLLEGTSFKLHVIVTYEVPRSSKTGQDVLGHKFYHLLASDGGQWFRLYPFGKIIHVYQQELHAPQCRWESSHYVYSPLMEGPGACDAS